MLLRPVCLLLQSLIRMWQQEPLSSFRKSLRDAPTEQQLVQLAYSLSNNW